MNAEGGVSDMVVRTATAGDIPALVKLHIACFRPEEQVPVMLGADYVRATYRWLLGSKSCYCLVATLNGRIVGLAGICDGPYAVPMLVACLTCS